MASIEADDKGWYIKPEFQFMGIKVILTARVEATLRKKDSRHQTGGNIGEVTKWQAIYKSEKT
ncbi:MAG: hypothetical protein LBE34_02370 [Flavobacteriaceae bacterium]|jgi:hypothetical protein|nr:hypothetical protein [Flavobacteriaceae bacterium]